MRKNSPPMYPLIYLNDDTGDESPVGALERSTLFAKLTQEMDRLVESIGRRNMGKISNNLLYLEPRCLWCYRTKAHLSVENNVSSQLLNCSHCLGATYCCSEHQEKGKTAHTVRAEEGGLTEVCGSQRFIYITLTLGCRQCDIFKICTQDDNFFQYVFIYTGTSTLC